MSLLTNLISYWKLDEASGNALDAHGSNTLTNNNAVGSATGKIGNCRDFEELFSQHFSRADNADLRTGDIDFTLQVWVMLETKSAVQSIIGKWNSPSSDIEYLLYYDSSADRFTLIVQNAANTASESVFANNFGGISTGTWHLIHCWHDSVANQLGIAINAGTPNTTSHSGGVRSGTAAFELGRNDLGVNYFDGRMDEAGFWKRVLTSQERTDLYNGGNGLPYSSFGGANVTVTPSTATLTLTRYAPSVLTPRLITPGKLSLTLTTFAPTIRLNKIVTPTTASLTTTKYAPTVSTPQVATPATKALTITAYAPTTSVSASQVVTPSTATLTVARLAPTVITPRTITPSTRSLMLAAYAPAATVSASKVVTPGRLQLAIQVFAPYVFTPRAVTPGTKALVLATYAPTVGSGEAGTGVAGQLNYRVFASPSICALISTQPTIAATVSGKPSICATVNP